MIQPRRRRLNPTQSIRLQHAIPIDWDFRVSDEDVSGRQQFIDPFLPGVDDFEIGSSGLNLCDMMRFDGVTQYDAHERRSCFPSAFR